MDLQSLRKFDSQDMLGNINGFYGQLEQGLEIGHNTRLPDIDTGSIRNIVLAGMGGSAIGGDLLRSFLGKELKIPFTIHRNYDVPGTVNKNTLLICSSYSGGTEETLSAFDSGVKAGCTILCITTGGKLADKARVNNATVITIPGGMMPRAALGYSFTPLLTVFGRLGLCRDYSNDITACAARLKSWSDDYQFDKENNIAYDIATKLAEKLIIIYSGPDYFDTVALRIKGQISENAKQHAFCNVFPEFNHNELVGWELTPNFVGNFTVLTIRDKDDHVQVAKRMDIVKKIIEEKEIEVIEIRTKGESLLERIFSLIQLGDYISYYLALINEVDPTPIKMIDYMKSKLADNQETR